MRRVFPALSFVSLELPSKAEQAEGDPDAFLARHPSPVVIDEVQYAPALIRHLHVAVQRDRDRKGALLLTGSVPPILLESVSESLAGRVSIIQLEPLSYAEAKAANPDLLVEEFLVRGGFPELCAKPEIEPCDFYRSYVPTYLERDLCQLLRVSSLRDFEGFLRAAALKTAQLLNRTDLARDVGISGSTAFAWISVLEGQLSTRAAQTVVRRSGKTASQTTQTVPARSGSRLVPVRTAFGRRPAIIAIRRCALGNPCLRRDPSRTTQQAREMGSQLLARRSSQSGFLAASGRQVRSRRREVDPAPAVPRCSQTEEDCAPLARRIRPNDVPDLSNTEPVSDHARYRRPAP